MCIYPQLSDVDVKKWVSHMQNKTLTISAPRCPSGFLSVFHLLIFISKCGELTDIYDANRRP